MSNFSSTNPPYAATVKVNSSIVSSQSNNDKIIIPTQMKQQYLTEDQKREGHRLQANWGSTTKQTQKVSTGTNTTLQSSLGISSVRSNDNSYRNSYRNGNDNQYTVNPQPLVLPNSIVLQFQPQQTQHVLQPIIISTGNSDSNIQNNNNQRRSNNNYITAGNTQGFTVQTQLMKQPQRVTDESQLKQVLQQQYQQLMATRQSVQANNQPTPVYNPNNFRKNDNNNSNNNFNNTEQVNQGFQDKFSLQARRGRDPSMSELLAHSANIIPVKHQRPQSAKPSKKNDNYIRTSNNTRQAVIPTNSTITINASNGGVNPVQVLEPAYIEVSNSTNTTNNNNQQQAKPKKLTRAEYLALTMAQRVALKQSQKQQQQQKSNAINSDNKKKQTKKRSQSLGNTEDSAIAQLARKYKEESTANQLQATVIQPPYAITVAPTKPANNTNSTTDNNANVSSSRTNSSRLVDSNSNNNNNNISSSRSTVRPQSSQGPIRPRLGKPQNNTSKLDVYGMKTAGRITRPDPEEFQQIMRASHYNPEDEEKRKKFASAALGFGKKHLMYKTSVLGKMAPETHQFSPDKGPVKATYRPNNNSSSDNKNTSNDNDNVNQNSNNNSTQNIDKALNAPRRPTSARATTSKIDI